MRKLPLLFAWLVVLADCSGEQNDDGSDSIVLVRGVAKASADTATPPARVIPIQESLRTFRAGVTEVRQLDGGIRSRDALLRRFVAALSANDTAAFRTMTLDRAEFAYLYYPSHPFARPPYELDAETMWLQLTANSGKGLGRLLATYGGQRLTYVSHRCARESEDQGSNRLWKDCTMIMSADSGRVEASLFGDVVERDERFAFVSYANQL